MEQISLIVRYTAYVDKFNLKKINRRKLESDLEDQVRNNLERICVAPPVLNPGHGIIEFDLQDMSVATNLVLAARWEVL